MIGGDRPYSFDPTQTWFFDTMTYHALGSLDPLHQLAVYPEVISTNGLVAGWGRDSLGLPKGFIWNLEEGLKPFDLPKGDGKCSYKIVGINESGQVLCNLDVETEKDIYRLPFLYIPGIGQLPLGTLRKQHSAEAHALNNFSQVVGSYFGPDNWKGKAFIWDMAHGMKDLCSLIPQHSGWILYEANAINNAGYIVGKGSYHGKDRLYLLIPKN